MAHSQCKVWETHLFFPTKKDSAPAGDEDGRIRPAFNDDSINSVMSSSSEPEIEYSLPLGIAAPEIKSMGQS